MKKQITPRQKSEFARRKAMGIALIEKPLRLIASKDFTSVFNKKTGAFEKEMGEKYVAANIAASVGRGDVVQSIARQFL